MSHEITPQIDLWNHPHYPQALFNVDNARKIIAQYDPNQLKMYGLTGFYEFEQLIQTPEGLLGLDLDEDFEPNIELIFAVNPWTDPSSDMYYLKGNFGQPLMAYRYISDNSSPRRMKTIKKKFFAIMHSENKSSLQEMTQEEVLSLLSYDIFKSILTFGYVYSPPRKI